MADPSLDLGPPTQPVTAEDPLTDLVSSIENEAQPVTNIGGTDLTAEEIAGLSRLGVEGGVDSRGVPTLGVRVAPPAAHLPRGPSNVASIGLGYSTADRDFGLEARTRAAGEAQRGALGDVARVEGEVAGAEAQAIGRGLDLSIQQETRTADIADRAMPEIQRAVGQLREDMQRVATMRVDPNQYYSSMGGFARIMSAIAIGMETFAHSVNPNVPLIAAQMLNEAIDRDIDAQRANIEAAQRGIGIRSGILGQQMDMYQNEIAATSAARLIISQDVQARIEQLRAEGRLRASPAQAEAIVNALAVAQGQHEQAFIASVTRRSVEMSAQEARSAAFGRMADIATAAEVAEARAQPSPMGQAELLAQPPEQGWEVPPSQAPARGGPAPRGPRPVGAPTPPGPSAQEPGAQATLLTEQGPVGAQVSPGTTVGAMPERAQDLLNYMQAHRNRRAGPVLLRQDPAAMAVAMNNRSELAAKYPLQLDSAISALEGVSALRALLADRSWLEANIDRIAGPTGPALANLTNHIRVAYSGGVLNGPGEQEVFERNLPDIRNMLASPQRWETSLRLLETDARRAVERNAAGMGYRVETPGTTLTGQQAAARLLGR